MRTTDILRRIVAGILSAADPERIILFGSQARGGASSGSDFDVLVVQESAEPCFRRSAPLYAAPATVPAEVDVVVYTPEEVREWSQVPQAFITTAIREGQVLYERKP